MHKQNKTLVRIYTILKLLEVINKPIEKRTFTYIFYLFQELFNYNYLYKFKINTNGIYSSSLLTDLEYLIDENLINEEQEINEKETNSLYEASYKISTTQNSKKFLDKYKYTFEYITTLDEKIKYYSEFISKNLDKIKVYSLFYYFSKYTNNIDEIIRCIRYFKCNINKDEVNEITENINKLLTPTAKNSI